MRKLTFLFALLCVSVMGWAEPVVGSSTENMEGQPGFTNGYDYSFATEGTSVIISFTEKENYEDLVAYLWNYTNGFSETPMTVSGHTASITLTGQTAGTTLDFACKFAFAGGMSVTKRFTYTVEDTGAGGSDPEPATIDWSSVSWLGNGIGAGFDSKYKAVATPAGMTINNLQPNADKNCIHVICPSPDFGACSLAASEYHTDGAGLFLHLDAFTAQETEFTIVCSGTTYTFTVYYADGTTGGEPTPDPEPTEIYDTNLALVSLGASATSDNGGTANNAIDNNDGSNWESTHGIDAVKLTIDLGQKRIFNTVQIRWEGAYGKAFTIDVSNDGSDWTTVKSVDETLPGPFPYEQTLEFAKTTAQYIRFNGIQRGTQWGYNMFSFRVLLPGESVLTSIDLTAAAQTAKIGAGVALTATPKDQNGQTMAETVSYEITPTTAGHMDGNTYIPDQTGSASIVAYNGEIRSAAVSVFGVPSDNLALSTNISTDNKVIVQSAENPNGSDKDAFFAVDGNAGSVWQGRPDNISGGDEVSRTFDAWFVVDLGAYYNIALVSINFEGACSQDYHIDFSANNTDWNLAYNHVGNAGINGGTRYLSELDNNTKVRYVRFWSTKAATEWGMKMYEFEVYGTEWTSGDDEKPVMVSASLVSSTINSAVIAVSATDNDEVARYHVVDNANGIDANFTPSEGKITINGLTHATDYNFTITAKDASNNESENSMVVAVSTPFDGSINLALNQPCEGGYYDNNPAESADKANDGNNGTSWVTYGDHAAALDWWVVDLGNVYNLTNITALWANDAYATQYMLQARVDAPTNEDKADDAAWVTLETVSGVTAGEERSTNVSGVGRYVRFRALAHTGFFRLREFRVYASGVAEVDTEAPVMTSASLVSNTDSHAVIAVAATDNSGIAKYHVVDAGNSFDAEFAAEGGNITVTGLNGGTNYTLVITAIDFFGNESANSKSVEVITDAHFTEPQAACPAPEWPAAQVKALYSPTYSADYNHQDWGGGTVYTQEEYGKKYVTKPAPQGYFGADGFSLNCLQMEKLHYDIWIADDATIRIVPIWGAGKPEQGITVNLAGQQWNSIDINLSEYSIITDWSNIYQMKIDQAYDLTFWVANAYFYRESAIVDNEAPVIVSASITEIGFNSVKVTVRATDDSGAVDFSVKNGDVEVATAASASGEEKVITVTGLTAGTTYNLKVVASDGANNKAESSLLTARTKVIPPAAPAPDFTGMTVVPVYTDAMDGAPTINIGGWGQSTVALPMELASEDNAYYLTNYNYLGWEFAEPHVNATGMNYLHVDVYAPSMTQIGLTPISPNHELSTLFDLTPGVWTSLDIPLSTFAAANIEWNDVFQFKFDRGDGSSELFIDNVYFYYIPEISFADDASNNDLIADNAGKVVAAEINRDILANDEWYTLCVPFDMDAAKVNEVFGPSTIATLVSSEDRGSLIHLNFDYVKAIEAGKPYLIKPTKSFNEGDIMRAVTIKNVDPIQVGDALMKFQGTYNPITLNAENQRFVGPENYLYSPADGGTEMGAFRCFFTIPEGSIAGAPGKRARIVFGEQVATGIGDVQSDNVQCTKVLQNGVLLIIRDGKTYNAQGILVK